MEKSQLLVEEILIMVELVNCPKYS